MTNERAKRLALEIINEIKRLDRLLSSKHDRMETIIEGLDALADRGAHVRQAIKNGEIAVTGKAKRQLTSAFRSLARLGRMVRGSKAGPDEIIETLQWLSGDCDHARRAIKNGEINITAAA
jgi:hypothetical protein